MAVITREHPDAADPDAAETRRSAGTPAPAGTPARQGIDPVLLVRHRTTGEIVGSVPATDPTEIPAIAARVVEAGRAWGARPVRERLAVLRRVRALTLERAEELARLLSAETGKTVTEAIPNEIAPLLDACAWLEKNAERHLAPINAGRGGLIFIGRRHQLTFEPLGAVGLITPFNYPLTIASAGILFNLVAGNGILWKPASLTALTGEAFAAILRDAGLPPDVVRVVHGGPSVGEALVTAPGLAKIFFTGSDEVGRRVMELAAGAPVAPRPVVLELGGKDAMLVLADADLDRAVGGALFAGFSNAGQTCASVKRLYVAAPAAAEFEKRLAARAAHLRPGDPGHPATQLGTMANHSTKATVVELVDDAVGRGARVVVGGSALDPAHPDLPGHYEATILADVPPDARIWHEEIFGPVITLATFGDEEEAVHLANDSAFGLTASVWSRDLRRARSLADRLEAGSVTINDHLYTGGASQLAWAGRRRSGFGITRSRFGLWECSHVKSVGTDPGWFDPPWWHPWDASLFGGFLAGLGFLYADGWRNRFGWLLRGGRTLPSLARRVVTSAVRSRRSRGASRPR